MTLEAAPPRAAGTGHRRRHRHLIVGLLALLGIGATLFVGLRAGTVDSTATGPGPATETRDAPAPALAGSTLTGSSFDLADLRDQVVLVNVWASWCGPCRAELPLLATARRRWSDRGLRVVGINVRDAAGPARQLLSSAGAIDLPVLADPEGTTAVAWGVRGVPETFLVDRTGRIRVCARGAITADWLVQHIPPLLDS